RQPLLVAGLAECARTARPQRLVIPAVPDAPAVAAAHARQQPRERLQDYRHLGQELLPDGADQENAAHRQAAESDGAVAVERRRDSAATIRKVAVAGGVAAQDG